jgi:DNA-3-methyladenine glycosylase
MPLAFYQETNAEMVAKALLGKVLCTNTGGIYTSAIIVETEAYKETGDRACHSYGGRRTKRTAVMYEPGGLVYVYVCYGIHHLFNIITGPAEQADGVLIRAGEPLEGEDIMANRRSKPVGDYAMLKGPGALSQALGIDLALYGLPVTSPHVWLEDRAILLQENELRVGPRIGVDSSGEDALHPWRYWVAGSRYVSGKRA